MAKRACVTGLVRCYASLPLTSKTLASVRPARKVCRKAEAVAAVAGLGTVSPLPPHKARCICWQIIVAAAPACLFRPQLSLAAKLGAMGTRRRKVGRDVERVCDAEVGAMVSFLRARNANKLALIMRRR